MNKNIIAIAIASLGFVSGLGLLEVPSKTETNLKIPFLLLVWDQKIHFRPHHLERKFLQK
jgi:hypothetical protein